MKFRKTKQIVVFKNAISLFNFRTPRKGVVILNILIVSETFRGGGLETHIYAYYRELREKHHFVFAFHDFESSLELNQKDIYTGYNFHPNCSIENFIADSASYSSKKSSLGGRFPFGYRCC